MISVWFGGLLAFDYLDVDLWDGSDLEDRLDLGASAARTYRNIELLSLSRIIFFWNIPS